MASPIRPLVDKIVGGLPEFIASRRADGLSFSLIARELSEITGSNIATETVRRWEAEDAA